MIPKIKYSSLIFNNYWGLLIKIPYLENFYWKSGFFYFPTERNNWFKKNMKVYVELRTNGSIKNIVERNYIKIKDIYLGKAIRDQDDFKVLVKIEDMRFENFNGQNDNAKILYSAYDAQTVIKNLNKSEILYFDEGNYKNNKFTIIDLFKKPHKCLNDYDNCFFEIITIKNEFIDIRKLNSNYIVEMVLLNQNELLDNKLHLNKFNFKL